MARHLMLTSLIPRSKSLITARVLPLSIVPYNKHSLAAQNHCESDVKTVCYPVTNTSTNDTIIVHHRDSLHSMEKPAVYSSTSWTCKLTDIEESEHEYIEYLKRQNILRQYRREWLRYNLAMKNCVEDIFMCSSSSDQDELERSTEHAKLYEVRDYLASHLQHFFVKTHNYSMYHKELIFENNYYHPSRTHYGINAYIIQVNKYRWLASFCYAHAKFQILKITAQEADRSVRVRWRITGLPNLAAFAKFWKFFPGKYKNSLDHESDWHDGYSTFFLNKDGVIVKHRVDKVIPDDELAVDKKPGLAVKLGLTLRPSVGD